MSSFTPSNEGESTASSAQRRSRHVLELCVFAMLGALMFCSKIIMEVLPNIHLLGMLTMVITLVFRKKALIPLYLYVFINGLYAGFATWWVPYLYVWTVLWGITMLLPRRLPRAVAFVVYPLVNGLFGLAFGTLYAPGQALLFGFSWEQTMAWILAGLPWDLLHGLGNLCVGILILPLSELLQRLMRRTL